MNQTTERRKVSGGLFLMIVVFVDIALAVWGWHYYSEKKRTMDASGLDISRPPEAVSRKRASAPRSEEAAPASGSIGMLVKESRGELREIADSPPAPKTPPNSIASPAQSVSPDEKKKVKRAVGFYYSLKRNPRFKNSKLLKDWSRDFLSDPALKKINDDYQKDRDPIKFVVKTAGSPAFTGLMAKYMGREDAQVFARTMAGSNSVKEAAGIFSDDPLLGALARRFGVGGKKP